MVSLVFNIKNLIMKKENFKFPELKSNDSLSLNNNVQRDPFYSYNSNQSSSDEVNVWNLPEAADLNISASSPSGGNPPGYNEELIDIVDSGNLAAQRYFLTKSV